MLKEKWKMEIQLLHKTHVISVNGEYEERTSVGDILESNHRLQKQL